MEFMEQAVEMAAQWGPKVIGLGSMTGVVGGQGKYLAEHSPVPVTTGNSLTVFAAIENVHHIAAELEIDLRHETVAVVGVPGSIATACAKLLAPHCGHFILVGRRPSDRAKCAGRGAGCDARIRYSQSRGAGQIVVSATSTGHCIEQSMLKPWSVVVDVAIPTDICESHATRDDVLILSGGSTQIPDCMPRSSKFLWFHHGMIPSCLAETMVLALEERPECFSLGAAWMWKRFARSARCQVARLRFLAVLFLRFAAGRLGADSLSQGELAAVRPPAAGKAIPAAKKTATRRAMPSSPGERSEWRSQQQPRTPRLPRRSRARPVRREAVRPPHEPGIDRGREEKGASSKRSSVARGVSVGCRGSALP